MKTYKDRSFLLHGILVRMLLNKIGAFPEKFELMYGYMFDRKRLCFLYRIRLLEKDVSYISNFVKKIEERGYPVIDCHRKVTEIYADLWIVNYHINPILKLFLRIQHRLCEFDGLNHEPCVYDATKHRIEYISDFF